MSGGSPLRLRFVILLATLLAGSFAVAQTPSRYKVAGQVVERGTGEPVVMASVVIEELGLWAVTDAEGRFELTKVPSGRQELEVSLRGYETRKFPLDVKGYIARR